MKVRVITDRYKDVIQEIRFRVSRNEFISWSAISIDSNTGNKVKRIVFAPEGNDQYNVVQLGFFGPSKEDVAQGFLYFDIVPKPCENLILEEKEFRNKSGVVLGFLTELLINNFPDINQLTVYTK